MWVLAVLGPSATAPRDERLADQAALARLARGDQSALAELYDRRAACSSSSIASEYFFCASLIRPLTSSADA